MISSHGEREGVAPAALLLEGATTLRVAGAAPVMAELRKEAL
jgi:hypothetical protein